MRVVIAEDRVLLHRGLVRLLVDEGIDVDGVITGSQSRRHDAWRHYVHHWHQTPESRRPDAAFTEHHLWTAGWS